ncbi:unnamed protein product, partial [Iphiclides podalirius]
MEYATNWRYENGDHPRVQWSVGEVTGVLVGSASIVERGAAVVSTSVNVVRAVASRSVAGSVRNRGPWQAAIVMHPHFTRTVRSIIEEFRTCDDLPALSSRYTINLTNNLRRVKKRALTFWFVIYSNCILYILKPHVIPGRHVMEDFFILYGLEPMFETPNYEIALFTLSASSVFIGHLTSNITAFHIAITGYVEAQMLALSEELVHLWDDVVNEHQDALNTDKKILNDSVKKRLKDIIERHAVSLNLHRRVDSLFRVAIAIEFLLLVLALTAELLGGLKNTYMEVPFAMLLVATDCWTGQRVVDASDTFEASVYDSKWENFNKENMRTVFLMELMVQRTLTMSAGGVAMLDRACFMSINKYIYSTYTTLESVMK